MDQLGRIFSDGKPLLQAFLLNPHNHSVTMDGDRSDGDREEEAIYLPGFLPCFGALPLLPTLVPQGHVLRNTWKSTESRALPTMGREVSAAYGQRPAASAFPDHPIHSQLILGPTHSWPGDSWCGVLCRPSRHAWPGQSMMKGKQPDSEA